MLRSEISLFEVLSVLPLRLAITRGSVFQPRSLVAMALPSLWSAAIPSVAGGRLSAASWDLTSHCSAWLESCPGLVFCKNQSCLNSTEKLSFIPLKWEILCTGRDLETSSTEWETAKEFCVLCSNHLPIKIILCIYFSQRSSPPLRDPNYS